MAVVPIKMEVHNAQFFGDVVTGTTLPRDMAAVRRCAECSHESILPTWATHRVMSCPSCGRETFRRKFSVRFNTGGKPRFLQIFHGNPYLEGFPGSPDMTLMLGTQIACNESGRTECHITEAFRLSLMAKTGFQFPMGERIPDLHLTDDEKALPPLVEGNYWIIGTGKRPPFTSKFWPPERWQRVVDSLPEITFVHVGYDDGKPNSEHYHPKLYGENVIDMIGQTQDDRSGIRELFRLVYHGDGCLSLVSSLMHVAAGFRKPCVVVAGAREPAQFELYPFHRYIHNQGSMECVGEDTAGNDRDHQGTRSCWKESAAACPNLEQGFPKCMMMIEPFQVTNALKSYYVGGALEAPKEKGKKVVTKKPIFKLACNAHSFGGGERSAIYIANKMLLEGFDVHVLPTRSVNREFSTALSPFAVLDSQEHPLTEPCDILMVYANDMTYALKERYSLLSEVKAERKIMVINYRLGEVGEVEWSKGWDQYVFLCSDMEQAFKKRVPDANTLILPPPVDLQPFLEMDLGSLDKTLRVVRIGSQGDAKYPKNIRQIVEKIKEVHPSVKFSFMGGHESLKDLDYVDSIPAYSLPVLDVLKRGNVFWYILPENYLDNGPRVVMEAMAAGLPIIADNRGGAAERLTSTRMSPSGLVETDSGWLCNSIDDHVEIFSKINGKTLVQKGRAARERAKTFNPRKWIEAILDGTV